MGNENVGNTGGFDPEFAHLDLGTFTAVQQ